MANLGKILKKEDGYQITLERTFNHNIEKVWDAITNPEKIKMWFTDVKMDFKEGSRITLYFSG